MNILNDSTSMEVRVISKFPLFGAKNINADVHNGILVTIIGIRINNRMLIASY